LSASDAGYVQKGWIRCNKADLHDKFGLLDFSSSCNHYSTLGHCKILVTVDSQLSLKANFMKRSI